MTYIAHLADDSMPTQTACGEVWQGWQEPADADRSVTGAPHPPHSKPRPHLDLIHLCGACNRRIYELIDRRR